MQITKSSSLALRGVVREKYASEIRMISRPSTAGRKDRGGFRAS
jgi:hypothetical protein